MIYLDNNSTCKPSEKVLGAMTGAPWANSNSLHTLGIAAKIALVKAEATIREAIGASNGHIMWTSGGAEANHIALDRKSNHPGTRYICPATEHKSVLSNEANVGIIPVDADGVVEIETLLSERYTKHANTIALMMVNNETGVVHNPSLLKTRAKSESLRVHTDAVQALGKIRIDVDEMGVDTLSISAHKIGGPKGIGVLWSRYELASYRKPNTLNVPAIKGFAAAVEDIRPEEFHQHCLVIQDRMVEMLQEVMPYTDDMEINTSLSMCTTSTLNLRFPGVDGFELTQRLSDKGIYISMGSACNEGLDEPSHVLIAMGLTPEQANSSVRISFSRENTLEEVEQAAKEIILCVKELRKK